MVPPFMSSLAPLDTTLAPDKEAFAQMLLERLPIAEAGKRLGVSRATAYRWAEDASVLDYISKWRQGLRKRAQIRASQQVDDSMERLIDAQTNPDVTPTMLKATLAVLSLAEVKVEETVKHIGDANQPIVLITRMPHNENARAEQDARRNLAIEGEFTLVDMGNEEDNA